MTAAAAMATPSADSNRPGAPHLTTVEFRGVSKRFRRKTAIDDVSFAVRRGEIFVLLGPTGAGKTTTLRIAAGLERPDAGSVLLDGADVNGRQPYDRDIAFVFEGLNILPPLSVFDNVAFALRSSAYREDEDEIARRVEQVGRDLQISHLLTRRPETLSGGETQRVAIARALVRRPIAYLFDEPLSALDLKLREALRTEIRSLHAKYQSTIVYATHDYIGAIAVADRIGILHAGRLHQIGTEAEIRANPATATVATFFGNPAMNLLPCRLDDGALRLNDEVRFALPPLRDGARLAPDGRYLLGVWPWDLDVAPAPGDGRHEGHVYAREFRGVETVLQIRLGEHRLNKVVEADHPARQGDPCWFGFDPADAYLYDADTGRCLTPQRGYDAREGTKP